MQNFWIYPFAILAMASIIVLGVVGIRLRKSSIRVQRALDPIAQKAKTLKIEVSALKRSRFDRQRRLESTGTIVTIPDSKV
jgi:uncharacterized membrane-anchored protein YhcB (DUF1043 family)